MLIEASAPLKLKLPTEDVHLQPGVPVALPDSYAQRLLAKVPGKIRVLHPGDRLCWDSPLFGVLEGELLAVRENGMIAVFHPLKDGVAEIPVTWLIQRRTAP